MNTVATSVDSRKRHIIHGLAPLVNIKSMSDIEIIWLPLYNTLNRTEDKKNVQTSTNQSISPEKKKSYLTGTREE